MIDVVEQRFSWMIGERKDGWKSVVEFCYGLVTVYRSGIERSGVDRSGVENKNLSSSNGSLISTL